MLSTIADILGILSFLMSVVVFIMSHSIFKYIQSQRKEYNNERIQLQSSLKAIRKNILDDNLVDIKIRSKLREQFNTYLLKYWKISSPLCLYHIMRTLRMCRNDLTDVQRELVCESIDYLIARFNKKEEIPNV